MAENDFDFIDKAEENAMRAQFAEEAKEDAMMLEAYRNAGMSTADAMSLIVTYRLTQRIAKNGGNL